MVECLGCEYIHFLHKSWVKGNNDKNGKQIYTTIYYPAIEVRRSPTWHKHFFSGMPREIDDLLHEIYISLQNGALQLCALGVRALLEQIMIDRVGDHKSLGSNIAEFFKQGYVAERQQNIFREKLIEIGNAAMHRGYRPKILDLTTILDITENILASIYVHNKAAQSVAKDIPPRGKS